MAENGVVEECEARVRLCVLGMERKKALKISLFIFAKINNN